jgi:hypothetical protein
VFLDNLLNEVFVVRKENASRLVAHVEVPVPIGDKLGPTTPVTGENYAYIFLTNLVLKSHSALVLVHSSRPREQTLTILSLSLLRLLVTLLQYGLVVKVLHRLLYLLADQVKTCLSVKLLSPFNQFPRLQEHRLCADMVLAVGLVDPIKWVIRDNRDFFEKRVAVAELLDSRVFLDSPQSFLSVLVSDLKLL